MALNILLVDDNENIRNSLKMTLMSKLGQQNLNFIEADDGETGIAAHKEANPDIIITDWEMLYMHGPEMVQMIRVLDKETPIIMLSGNRVNWEKEAEEAGATHAINKGQPNTNTVLVAAIKMAFPYLSKAA